MTTGRQWPIDAIVFDLDGTLLDSLADLADTMNAVLQTNGYAMHPQEAYRHFVGTGMEALVRRTLPEHARTPDEIAARLEDTRQEYARRWADSTRPYAGVPQMLDALQDRDLPMAVLSNKPDDFTSLTVERLLSDWSFAQVRGQRPDTPTKPDPAGAYAIAEALSVDPARVLYVGDTSTDMQTGRAAGMVTIGVTWGFRDRPELEEHGAHTVIDEPSQLLTLLEERKPAGADEA